MSWEETHPLDEILHPQSIAIVGASASQQAGGWVSRLLNFGYTGRLYPVNPRAAEISGLKAYPTVRNIPGPVDYAIFNIPARLAPQIMEDCVAKGVKAAHIFTAVLEAQQRLLKAGIPVYPTIEAAASAISKLIEYHAFAIT